MVVIYIVMLLDLGHQRMMSSLLSSKWSTEMACRVAGVHGTGNAICIKPLAK